MTSLEPFAVLLFFLFVLVIIRKLILFALTGVCASAGPRPHFVTSEYLLIKIVHFSHCVSEFP